MKIIRFAMVLLLALQVVGIIMLAYVNHTLHGGPAWDATPEAQEASTVWVAAVLAAWAVSVVYGVLALLKKAPRDTWMSVLVALAVLPYAGLYFVARRFGGGI